MKKQFNITGMSCQACSTRVEKSVLHVPGVTECTVSLLTNVMAVEGEALEESIIKAVHDAGYGATAVDSNKKKIKGKNDIKIEDNETKEIRTRLIASLLFLIILMYVSMGHMMFDFPLPSFFEHNMMAIGIVEMLLAGIIMVINQKFFVNGFKSLWNKSPNMDSLVALGSMTSFIWSVIILLKMTELDNIHSNEMMKYMDELYFESAAMILALITVGKMLEARSKGKTTNALKNLMELMPESATILRDGEEYVVDIDEVKKGDIFIVKPGDRIPVDGTIVDGVSAIDESSVTGESIPVDKTVNDTVVSGTINQSGYLKCEATKVGEDTTLSLIIKMVSDAATTKAPIAKVADKVSAVFVPVVISIAILTFFIWIFIGESISFSLARGISVLVISCPCALGLATPVAIMVGNGVGARNGILFKNATSLEEAGRVKTVVLDKTGTITKGQPEVTDIVLINESKEFENIKEYEFLEIAYALENKSEHPIARAIINKCIEKNIKLYDTNEFSIYPGNGVYAKYNGKDCIAGNLRFIEEYVNNISDNEKELLEKLSNEGKTPVIIALDGRILGIIAVADTIKEDSIHAVEELHRMGIKVVMLTGDNEITANAIGKKVGVDEIVASVLPDGKALVITELKKDSKVIMVGDGINDAAALASADIGIAIGAGTDVAIDAADIVLMNSNMYDVIVAIKLSKTTLRNIHENLFYAFCYNIVGIPLAAGAFMRFGFTLNPMFAAMAMSISSFLVVTNALRINMFKGKKERKSSKADTLKVEENKRKEEIDMMKKEIKIEGMMCGHCEATVKKVLEGIEGVSEAVVSHEKGNAIVTLDKNVPEDVLKKAVEDKDYKVLEIK